MAASSLEMTRAASRNVQRVERFRNRNAVHVPIHSCTYRTYSTGTYCAAYMYCDTGPGLMPGVRPPTYFNTPSVGTKACIAWLSAQVRRCVRLGGVWGGVTHSRAKRPFKSLLKPWLAHGSARRIKPGLISSLAVGPCGGCWARNSGVGATPDRPGSVWGGGPAIRAILGVLTLA